MFDGLSGAQMGWMRIGMVALGAVAVAYVVAEVAARLARLVLTRAVEGDPTARFTDPIVRTPIRITRGVVFASTLALISGPALTLLGVLGSWSGCWSPARGSSWSSSSPTWSSARSSWPPGASSHA